MCMLISPMSGTEQCLRGSKDMELKYVSISSKLLLKYSDWGFSNSKRQERSGI